MCPMARPLSQSRNVSRLCEDSNFGPCFHPDETIHAKKLCTGIVNHAESRRRPLAAGGLASQRCDGPSRALYPTNSCVWAVHIVHAIVGVASRGGSIGRLRLGC